LLVEVFQRIKLEYKKYSVTFKISKRHFDSIFLTWMT